MHTSFDALLNSYIDNNVGIADDFLGPTLSDNLKANLMRMHNNKLLLRAGTGNSAAVAFNTLLRGDRIYWLDKKHNDPFENEFFGRMDAFVTHLNSTCYTGITGYEFHYTLYDVGSYYKKHIDQFRNNNSRKYSMIIYLNEGWQQGDGGELCIHHADGDVQNIAPVNGKSVFFKSQELAHEVLLTNKPRMSITGWLKVGT